jgi:hypothetical protein
MSNASSYKQPFGCTCVQISFVDCDRFLVEIFNLTNRWKRRHKRLCLMFYPDRNSIRDVLLQVLCLKVVTSLPMSLFDWFNLSKQCLELISHLKQDLNFVYTTNVYVCHNMFLVWTNTFSAGPYIPYACI